MDLSSLPPGIIVQSNSPFLELKADSVDAFLSVLSPVDGLATAVPFKTLLFRGHADSSWKLTPKCRRKSEWPPAGLGNDVSDAWFKRLRWEVTSLLQFCRNADRQGLAIPQLSILRQKLISLLIDFNKDHDAMLTWPPSEAVPALALAQHYGLPTCLLDFSWNPYVAAYFAARGVMDAALFRQKFGTDAIAARTSDPPPKTERALCVWIINDYGLVMNDNSSNHRVKLLVPPASDNRTLQAQEGVFLWAPLNSIPHRLDEYSDEEQAIDTILGQPTSGCFVLKLCLAQEFAPMLLNRLVRLGYDGVRLFPSYEGAVGAVADHNWSGIGHPTRL